MAAVPLDPKLVSTFESITSSRDDSQSMRALLVRALPPGAMKPTLTLIQHFASSEGNSKSDQEEFSESIKALLLEKQEDVNSSGFVLFRLDSRAAAGSWEWICLHYQPDGAKVGRLSHPHLAAF